MKKIAKYFSFLLITIFILKINVFAETYDLNKLAEVINSGEYTKEAIKSQEEEEECDEVAVSGEEDQILCSKITAIKAEVTGEGKILNIKYSISGVDSDKQPKTAEYDIPFNYDQETNSISYETTEANEKFAYGWLSAISLQIWGSEAAGKYNEVKAKLDSFTEFGTSFGLMFTGLCTDYDECGLSMMLEISGDLTFPDTTIEFDEEEMKQYETSEAQGGLKTSLNFKMELSDKYPNYLLNYVEIPDKIAESQDPLEDNTSEEIENADTGAFADYLTLGILVLVGIVLIILMNKNHKFYKI